MSGPNAPRIIVIPQSMLTQAPTSGKSILRISPQGKLLPAMSSVGQGRILPSMSTVTSSSSRPLMTNTTSILSKPPVPTMMVKPVASVAGHKRPAPLSSLLMEPNTIKKERTEKEESHRKRANLDHLSPEERLMRRKLKNRVAAQTARDKKRVHLEDMEVIVRELREEKKRILEDNARLQATNAQLTMDNAALMRENQDLSSRLSLPVKTEQDTSDMAPFSPESMPRSPLPLHLLPLSPVSQPRSPAPPLECPPLPSAQKPSESAEGSGSMCGGQEASWPRVVVQRLDDLAGGDLDGVVAHDGVDGGQPVLPHSLHDGLRLAEITGAASFDEATITGAASFDETQGTSPIAPYQEEMQVGPGDEGVAAGVSFPLLHLGLETLMDAPSLNETPTMLDTPTTESMLDKLLESAMVGDMEDGKQWSQDLEDLFPDLV